MPVLLDGLQAPTASFSLPPDLYCLPAFGTSGPVMLALPPYWAAFLRDSLFSLGYRLDSTFDAWRSVLDPAHPLSSNRCRPHSSVSVKMGLRWACSAPCIRSVYGLRICNRSCVPRSRVDALDSLILAGSPLSLIMSEPLSLLSPLPFVLHPMPTLLPPLNDLRSGLHLTPAGATPSDEIVD
ncbi:hypothetical protein B0H13DRAFT_2325767 [Mycena leptocephala]|nr:hypothetical protein B0H13DRAFT_2325767 [Mycena leptocephala]